jgi:hypothetical protein
VAAKIATLNLLLFSFERLKSEYQMGRCGFYSGGFTWTELVVFGNRETVRGGPIAQPVRAHP